MDPYISLAIFAAYSITYALYAKFVRWVVDERPMMAATCSVATALFTLLGIMQCIDNRWYLIPLSLGAWLGTYVAIKFKFGEMKPQVLFLIMFPLNLGQLREYQEWQDSRIYVDHLLETGHWEHPGCCPINPEGD